MINKKLVRNYASALFTNALVHQLEDKVFEQITIINQAILAIPEVKVTMCSPIINKSDKFKAINLITTSFNIEVIVKHFLLVLVKNSRMFILPDIVVLYYQLLNESKNIKMVQITSSKALQLEAKQWIQDYLEKDLRQKVDISFNANQSIIGGFTIQYDSILKDYSIAGMLRKIQRTFNKTVGVINDNNSF